MSIEAQRLAAIQSELAYQRRFVAQQLRTYRSLAVGDNMGGGIGGMTPGFLIRGIIVDNPSGSWVKLGTDQYIPPYTFGWASTIAPALQTASAEYVTGPIPGLESTNVGLPAVFYLYDGEVANNAGSPVIPTQPNVTHVVFDNINAQVAGGNINIIPAPAAGRARVFKIRATLGFALVVGTFNYDTPIQTRLFETVTGFFLGWLYIAPPLNGTDELKFEGGQDLTPLNGLSAISYTHYGQSPINIECDYTII